MSKVQKPPLPQRVRTKLRRLGERSRRIGAGGDYRFVFIVTYGRTGSTLLQKLLNTLPGHYVAGENHGLLRGLYESWRDAMVLKEKYGWGHQATDHPWHGALMADPDGYAKALGAAVVEHVLKPPRGARVVGFKEIRYLGHDDLTGYLDFIGRVFSPALFVVNTRSVEQVSQSAWWKTADKDKLAANVAEFEAVTDRLAAERPDRFVKIDYATWTTDPEALRPVYALLGMDFDRETVARTLEVRLEHMRG